MKHLTGVTGRPQPTVPDFQAVRPSLSGRLPRAAKNLASLRQKASSKNDPELEHPTSSAPGPLKEPKDIEKLRHTSGPNRSSAETTTFWLRIRTAPGTGAPTLGGLPNMSVRRFANAASGGVSQLLEAPGLEALEVHPPSSSLRPTCNSVRHSLRE